MIERSLIHPISHRSFVFSPQLFTLWLFSVHNTSSFLTCIVRKLGVASQFHLTCRAHMSRQFFLVCMTRWARKARQNSWRIDYVGNVGHGRMSRTYGTYSM